MENIAHDSPAGAGKTVPAAVVVAVVVGGGGVVVVVPDQGEKFAVIYFAVAVAVKPLHHVAESNIEQNVSIDPTRPCIHT